MNAPRLQNILNFLQKREWTIDSEDNWFFKMKPPKSLEVGQEYRLNVANSEQFEDYESNINSIIKYAISKFYEKDIENLQLAFRNNAAILTLSLKSELFQAKSIDILHFNSIIQQLQSLIYQTATWLLKEHQATSEEQSQFLSTYLSNCNLVKIDIDTLQLKIELPAEGEWTLVNEKKITLVSIPNTLLDSLQKQLLTQTKSPAESVEIPIQQMRLLFAIQDFIESTGLTYAHFSFFNLDWEAEKEVIFGVEKLEVAEEKEEILVR